MTQMTKAYSYALVTVLMWSTIATAFKLALGHLDPYQLLFYASLTSLLFTLGLLIKKQQLGQLVRAMYDSWPAWLLLGALNPFLYHIFLFNAYDRLPAQQALALNYTWPMAMTLLAIPILKQKIRKLDIAAILTAYFGVLIIATRGELAELQFDDVPGVAMALASTLCWALYWLINTRHSHDPLISLTATFIAGLPMMTLVVAMESSFIPAHWHDLAGAVYVGLIEMGLAYVCWILALKHATNTAAISNLSYLSPLLSLFVIWLVLDEPIITATWAGLGFILGGIFLQKIRFKGNTANQHRERSQ
ncbi:DMT family transporter [Spongorhabdus nitratireducens]